MFPGSWEEMDLMHKTLMLALALGLAPTAAQAQAPVAAGAKLFSSRCAMCHYDPTKAAQLPRMGPSLRGVAGRKAGAHPQFARYSKAMKSYGKPWTDANLDAYLENPRKVVPGTNMAYAGLKKPDERAAVIAYLKTAR